MRRAGFWLRWSWRDLRSRWVLVAAIALVIALGTGLYTGLGSMETWRRESNDASYALLNAHDLRLSLNEGSYARSGDLRELADSIGQSDAVEAAEERLAVQTQVDASRAGETIITPGRVVGLDLDRGPPRVDGIATETGRNLRSADAHRGRGVLEASYADHYDLPATGTLRVGGGRPLRYVGQGRSPEYFLVTSPGGGDFGAAEANFGVIFAPIRVAQRIADRPGSVNELVLTLRPGTDLRLVERQLERALARGLPRLGAEITRLEDEPAHRVLYKDAEGDQRVFGIFALLILAGAAFASFNLATRIVEAQRREIGVGMALGVPRRELSVRPLLLGAEIALVGVLFGIAIGVLSGSVFRSALENLLPLPVIETRFEPGVFVRGAVIGFVVPLLATAYPVWRGVRVPPVEAIRVGFRSAKGGGLTRLVRGLSLPGRSVAVLPIRNALRAPRRALMTLLGVAAVITVIVALLGMIDSFAATTDRASEEIAGAMPSRMTVELSGFYPERVPGLGRTVEAVVSGEGAPPAVASALRSPEASELRALARELRAAARSQPGAASGPPGAALAAPTTAAPAPSAAPVTRAVRPVLERLSVLERVGDAKAVGAAEPRLRVDARLGDGGHGFDSSIELMPMDSPLWRPTVAEGRLPSPSGIVIAEEAADDLGVAVGDEIVVRHPRRTGPLTFDSARSRVEVTGLHPNPFRNFAFMDISQARLMGLRGESNTAAITPAPGFTQDEVKRALFDVEGVASAQSATASTDLLHERLDEFVGVLRATELFLFVLAVLIAFNSTSINADERARENATLLAFGYRARDAVGVALGENLIVGILGTLLGVGLGAAMLGWIAAAILPETFPDLGLVLSISTGSLVAAAIVGVLAVALAPLFTVRRLRRMDVPATLRVME